MCLSLLQSEIRIYRGDLKRLTSEMLLNKTSIRCKRCDFFATSKTDVVQHFKTFHVDKTTEDRRSVRIIECNGCHRFTAPDHRRMEMHKRICFRTTSPSTEKCPLQTHRCQWCNFRTFYKGKFDAHVTNRHNHSNKTDQPIGKKLIDKMPGQNNLKINIVLKECDLSNPKILTGNPEERIAKPHPEVADIVIVSNNPREVQEESGAMLGCLQCTFETPDPELFDAHWIEQHSKISLKKLLRTSYQNPKKENPSTILKIKVDLTKISHWKTSSGKMFKNLR